MSWSQAHVPQHQYPHPRQHQQHQLQQHHITSSKYYNTMETLPGISELVFGLSAKGGNGPSSPPMHTGGGGGYPPPPQRLGHADVVPPAPPQPNHTSHSREEPYYTHESVTQMPMSLWQANTGKGRGTEQYQYEQQPPRHTVQQQLQQPQQKQQQHKAQQYQPSPAGGMRQASQLSPPSPVPAKQYPLPMQGQHRAAVETWCINGHGSPWSPIGPRGRVSEPHSVKASTVNKPSPDSGAPVSPRSSRKESCSVAPRPGNGVYYEHDENAKQVLTRQVCVPEYHERSASCPTLHLTSPTPMPPRDIGRSNMHNGNYYNSSSFHEQSVAGAHGSVCSSPQIPKTLQNGTHKNLKDPSIHVNKQAAEMRTNDMVLSWGSLPLREPKPTTWGAAATSTISHANHHGSQLSNKSLSDLTSTAAGTWKQVPRGPAPSGDVNYYHNNNNINHNYPSPKTMGASGHTNDTGHRDSNAMEDYDSDRQPSQTPRASSSTTSSETRISDSGSVTKRRSISAPKREYRCTKKDGCHAVFSCNSLRKKHEMKHTKPFTCLQRSCPKHKVGFTTSNDLRRHMKALHGYRFKPSAASPSRGTSGVIGGDGSVDGGDAAEALPPVDAVGGWRCKYCAQMETPSSLGHVNPKGFFSTRKDNFRNHIKRMHGALKKDLESMDEFFRRSEMECRVDSPVLLPTVPSPEAPLAMDTDMDSPEANTTRGFGERRHGEQSGSGNSGFSVREDRGRLPSVEEWKGLPPPASSTQAAAHGHSRRDTLTQDTVSTNVSGRSGYHSVGGSREPDRNATSRQHQQSQQNDQSRGVGGGYYHQLQRSDRENVDSQGGGDYLSLGRNSNGQVEKFSGPEHPAGPSTRLASNGWTSVNRSSYNQQNTAHADGPRTTLCALAVRDAGAVVGSEEFSMAHPQVHIVGGAEELRRLDQEEENLLNELDRVRTAQKKLRDQLERRLLSSPQPTPARRTHIALPDQDVEMLDCESSHMSTSWFAQAEKPVSSAAVSARTVSVSQLLNAEDPDGSARPIGPTTSPSTNTKPTTHMSAVQEGAAEGLFLPPKSGSPPPPRWQFAAPTGVAGSPRGKSTTTTTTTAINTARGSTEVVPFRRQSLYNNRVKPGATNATGKGSSGEYKALCPHCQSSFRLPCQLRKHLKRHSKPFGCTHDGCNKVFGAKNDWKRHENSQHHQLECWKCDIRCLTATPGTAKDTPDICGKCFFRKADFVKHLKTVHGNADGWVVSSADPLATTGEQIQTTLTGERELAQIAGDCHIPKYHGGAFWCGFCRKVIKLLGKVGIAGWDKRFDHIAWHFEKNNLRVKDSWMRLEEPSPEGDGKAPGVSSAKDVEESSDEEDGDVEFHDSSPRRRQTESTPLPNYARQSQLEGVEGIPDTGSGSAETEKTWYCCKCTFGPYLNALYVDCPHCADHHRCGTCTLKYVVKKLK